MPRILRVGPLDRWGGRRRAASHTRSCGAGCGVGSVIGQSVKLAETQTRPGYECSCRVAVGNVSAETGDPDWLDIKALHCKPGALTRIRPTIGSDRSIAQVEFAGSESPFVAGRES